MHRIITYTLKNPAPTSDEYYQTISVFATKLFENIVHQNTSILSGFREYLKKSNLADRSTDEVAFEFLALGVFLLEYSNEISQFPDWLISPLNKLTRSRLLFPRFGGLFKILIGWLYGLVGLGFDKSPAKNNEMLRLVLWLEANGENIKAERFKQWYDYFNSNPNKSADEFTRTCLILAEEFEWRSLNVLGKYTENVESFLSSASLTHRWKYDSLFVSKKRLEYHLGMLGTEILNQTYRERFLFTKRKVVIVPPCMSAPEIKCKAIETTLGTKCTSCTPSCRVNQITKLGEKYGFDVFMIPDDMKVFSSRMGGEKTGVVGISCALTNWNGGWETGSMNIPSQGVLLDYAGCKYHWDPKGFPTDANLKILRSVLGIGQDV